MRPAAALVPAMLIWAASAGPASGKELEIKVSGGEGEVRRVFAPRDSAEAVLVLRFGSGYADEAEIQGGTLLSVHALLSMHRRVKYAELLQTFHGATARLSTSIGPHETTFTLRAHRDELMEAAEQLCTVLFSPAFDPSAFPGAVERAMVDGTARSPLHELLARLSLYTYVTDIRYRPDVEAERIETLAWPSVKRHLEGVFSPANATAVATGGFNPAAMEALLSRYSGGVRASPRPPKLVLPLNHRFRAREEALLFFFPMELDQPEKVAAVRVLAELLEERVGQRMRRLPASFPVEVRPLATVPFRGLAVSLPAHSSTGTDISIHVRQEAANVQGGRTPDEQFTAARAEAIRHLGRVDARPELLAEELLAGLEAAPGWVGPEVMSELKTLDVKRMVELLGPSLATEKSILLFFSPEVASSEATATPVTEVSR